MTIDEPKSRPWPPRSLRRVSAAQVELSALLGRELGEPVRIADQQWRVVVSALESPPSRSSRLSIGLGGQSLEIAITPADLERLLAVPLGAVALQALDEPTLSALLEDVVVDAAEWVGIVGSCDELVSGVGAGVGEEPWIRLALAASPDPALVLWVNTAGVNPEALASRLAPTLDVASDWHALPMEVRIEHGWALLPLKEVGVLRPGDAIVASTIYRPREGASILLRRSPSLGVHCECRADGSAVAITGMIVIHEEEHHNPGDVDDLADRANGLAMDALPVHLSFDLGVRTLTVGELGRISKGRIFDLGLRPESAVSIRANGTLIGTGELVDVDGRVGVSVIRIEAPRP